MENNSRRVFGTPLRLAVLLLLGFVAPVHAAQTVWVDLNGNCAGRAPCFMTIQQGINNAGPPPVTINVFPGMYDENPDLGLLGSAVGGMPGTLTLRTVNGSGSPANGTVSVVPATGAALRNTVANPGNVTIRGFTFLSLDNDGIQLGDLGGNLTIAGVVSSGNSSDGLSVGLNGGNVHISDSQFDDNMAGSGLSFSTAGDVTFENITANDNDSTNASFGVDGDVVINNSFFNGSRNSSGLSFSTAQNVTFDNVTANDNDSTNASFGVDGDVLITDSFFNGSMNSSGLSFSTAQNVTFDNVTANDNDSTNASFGVDGDVLITNSFFNGSKSSSGLSFSTAQNVTFDDVTANDNESTNASFGVDVDVRISNSTFNGSRTGNGLSFSTCERAFLEDVSASGNDESGATFSATMQVVLADSTFNDNKGGDGVSFGASPSLRARAITASGNDDNGLVGAPSSVGISLSTFADNGDTGVRLGAVQVEGAFAITCNDFLDNEDFGLIQEVDTRLNATNNFWNSPTGPTHPSNPGGTGDDVRDGANGGAGTALLIPFLTASFRESKVCGVQAPAVGTTGLALLAIGLFLIPAVRLALRNGRWPAIRARTRTT